MQDWSFACPDWRERLIDGRSLVPPLPLDRAQADKAVAIFNKLRLPDVAGRPELREAGGDWQRDIVAALCGSLMPDGRRKVRKPFVLVPKKNSKTTGSAGIMLTALLMDPEPRQPYYLYGPTQAIAQRGFDQAQGMILADPVLSKRFHIKAHLKTIIDQVTESSLRVQTFDESVATGVIPKGMLIDELHILGKMHYAERVLGQLWGGLVSKPAGFLMMITTQSDQPPAGVFRSELQLARAIRDGRVTGAAATTLPVLYEFPEEVQADRGADGKSPPWRDSKIWHQVLPNLGRSVQLDLLEQQYAEAVEKGDGELARWSSQHLNIEMGLGYHADRWRGADYWEDAADPTLTLESLLTRCEVAVIGIDGGGEDDLYGLCVAGRETGTGRWLFWCHAWARHEVLARRKGIITLLEQFAQEGDLTICDEMSFDEDEALATLRENGAVEAAIPPDIAGVLAIVEQVRASGILPEKDGIGVDPAGIPLTVDALNRIGIADDVIFPVAQAWRLNPAVTMLPRMLHSGMARHAAQPMMNWCVGNAKESLQGNNRTISKAVSGAAKIDPVIAMLNAFMLLARAPEACGHYDLDGFLANAVVC